MPTQSSTEKGMGYAYPSRLLTGTARYATSKMVILEISNEPMPPRLLGTKAPIVPSAITTRSVAPRMCAMSASVYIAKSGPSGNPKDTATIIKPVNDVPGFGDKIAIREPNIPPTIISTQSNMVPHGEGSQYELRPTNRNVTNIPAAVTADTMKAYIPGVSWSWLWSRFRFQTPIPSNCLLSPLLSFRRCADIIS